MLTKQVATTCGDSEMLSILTAKQNKNSDVSACSGHCNNSPECKFFSLREPEARCNLYSSCDFAIESNPSFIISTFEKGKEYVK